MENEKISPGQYAGCQAFREVSIRSSLPTPLTPAPRCQHATSQEIIFGSFFCCCWCFLVSHFSSYTCCVFLFTDLFPFYFCQGVEHLSPSFPLSLSLLFLLTPGVSAISQLSLSSGKKKHLHTEQADHSASIGCFSTTTTSPERRGAERPRSLRLHKHAFTRARTDRTNRLIPPLPAKRPGSASEIPHGIAGILKLFYPGKKKKITHRRSTRGFGGLGLVVEDRRGTPP